MALDLNELLRDDIEAAVEEVTGPMGDHTGQTEENITTEKTAYENFVERLPVPSLERMSQLFKEQSKGLTIDPFKMFRWDEKQRCYEPESVKFKGLTVLAARTGGGKTLALTSFLNLLLATKPDYHAVIFSLEESESAIFTRIAPGFFFLKNRMNGSPFGSSSVAFTQKELESLLLDQGTEGASKAAARMESEEGNDFFNRLHIITKQNYHETLQAMKAEAESQENKNFAEINFNVGVDDSATITTIIQAFRKLYGDKVVFFADFIQKMHSTQAQERDSWKEVKVVMNHLTESAESGAIIFTAAQMTREAAKEGGKKKDPVDEFYDVIAEHLREGADIEQAAELIFYIKIDQGHMNLRTLKHRGGAELSASAKVWFECQLSDFSGMEKATLQDEEHTERGTYTPVLSGSEEKKTKTTGTVVLAGHTKTLLDCAILLAANQTQETNQEKVEIQEKDLRDAFTKKGGNRDAYKQAKEELLENKTFERAAKSQILFLMLSPEINSQIKEIKEKREQTIL